MSLLAQAVKKHKLKVKPKRKAGPLWTGPSGEGPNGGVTQSMLGRFLTCRERFRIRYIEGLEPVEGFNHRLGYGEMWHLCEEAHASNDDWQSNLILFCRDLCRQYPTQQEQIQHWYNVCKVQFPIYVKYWAKQKDVVDRAPLLQEQVFDVPYNLPSGRIVRLRGKWDSVDLIGKKKACGLYLQENKTKGEIIEHQIQRQLKFDLQTMFYMVALKEYVYEQGGLSLSLAYDLANGPDLKGVRYNVVRRPLSGGEGTIRRHKPTKNNPQGETAEEFYTRLAGIIQDEANAALKEKRDCHFFMRWKTEITAGDILTFRQQFLDPILEQLCDWYEWVTEEGQADPFRRDENIHGEPTRQQAHWRHPYGSTNNIDEYGHGDVDEYMETGSMVGLQRSDRLFKELI